MAYEIKELHAFIHEDPNGAEGIVAFKSKGAWTPLIAADRVRLDENWQFAQAMADQQQITIKVVKFLARHDVATIHPTRPATGPGNNGAGNGTPP